MPAFVWPVPRDLLWRMSIARVTGIALALASLVVCAGCAATPVDPEPTNTFTTHTSLACSDGNAGAGPVPREFLLTDTVGAALRDGFGRLPKATDVGIPAPAPAWSFRKAPLVLTADAGRVTLTVPDDGKQFLLWVPSNTWVGANADGKRPWITAQVTATGCERVTSFFGGILVLDPERCFPLTIQQDGRPADELLLSGAGGTC
jgi:hypothetical protein